jgi:hypothetical protein
LGNVGPELPKDDQRWSCALKRMKIFEHYAELRREHAEYEDTVHTLECDLASLQGRVDQLEELNKQLTEERNQFLERYYRLVTQFELMGGSFDRARAASDGNVQRRFIDITRHYRILAAAEASKAGRLGHERRAKQPVQFTMEVPTGTLRGTRRD